MNKKNTIVVSIGLILSIVSALNKFIFISIFILIGLLILTMYLSKKGLNLLEVVIMLMTVHTFLFFHLLPKYFDSRLISIAAMWKDIIITLMLLLILTKKSINKSNHVNDAVFNKVNKSMIFFLTVCFFSIVFGLFKNPNNIYAYVSGFRVYCFPYVVYYIARNLKHTEKDCYTFMKRISYFFIFIALFGIIQQSILGLQFLSDFNYFSENGNIPTSFFIGGFSNIPRLFSTFDSPNNYGLFAFIPAMFFFADIVLLQHKSLKNYLSLIIILATIFLSFSRSSILALFFGFGIILLIKSREDRKIFNSIIKVLSLILILAIFIQFSKNSYIVMIKSQINATISLTDPSALGHIDSLKQSLTFVKNNPLGTGIGLNGPRSQRYFSNINNSESSYFVLTFDLGLVGLMFFLLIMIFVIRALIVKCNEKNIYIAFVSKCCLAIMVGISINYIFLPSSQDIIHSSFVYALIGLVSNYRKVDIFKSN